ncbi:hypothetical protein AJ85_01720 [Alkalihalobacillus alcalophilus ATCC 27647 = CGMCC 1.3604]|uniref:Bacterial membrane flanked domain protein n=1 Tax=Alkalihalobacillus alcalophilus ATCC 27647 = CGMCC 1.3604 TaxID=1218173 RepID=A0A094XAC7_ALKAL|nr:PH domain-containing protein [Alkalihalobacillus alcalophilus]KGA95715.1 bacterial membrane flanked domain protein [Alkalihalobacillus alcalophilus ATCC 27647 = CGMCC 1.3604]MED1564105.1 PH domain-containing protein [Alkalihalobacillus alcalophilus]THG88633.1 hypothetical protein AJ85_01720 [Alkalihalobacillus alcalophilus ATCC 27647 = CGMCC 1.3604]
MLERIQDPSQKISPDAVKVWRISALVQHIISILVLAIILFLQQYFEWFDWIGYVAIGLLVIDVLYGIFAVFIRPTLLQRTWRYEVDEDFIQLKFGVLTKRHYIIPMVKVQYVNTNQGPLLRYYHLSTLTVGTTASTHEIPAIPEQTAQALRGKIASFADLGESEQEWEEEELNHDEER